MKRFPNQEFEVKWLPFQLNPGASETGVNKMQMYMNKFNMNEQQCAQMANRMGQNFANVGLPYKFTPHGMTGNTFNSHRLINYAGSISEETQDKVVEELFLNYFGEEKFLNDPKVLIAAAVKAGISEQDATKLVSDPSFRKQETEKELNVGRQMRVSGVPHFVVTNASGEAHAVSGAQPAEVFGELFEHLSAE